MKNQTTTRFEVGMPVIYINDGEVIKAKVDTTNKPDDVLGSYPIVIGWEYEGNNYESETFNKDGFKCITHDVISLFTMPEYEALKKLTDSFVDGTFGSEQPKFEPQKGEPVLYKGSECNIEGTQTWYILKYPNGFESVRFVSPIEGYPYQNGFCIPLSKEQTNTEQPETTNLLDDYGRTVYFSEGQEVGCISLGRVGKVAKILTNTNVPVKVSFSDMEYDFYNYTIDGRLGCGVTPVLFPIEQYDTIQLPKLKPIQVAKPKADVISLPSWFKGGVHLENNHVCSFIQHQGIDTESAFDALISEFDIKASECDFSYCTIKRIGTIEKALCVDFVYQNKCYSLCIEIGFSESKPAIFEVHYQKNGKEIYEKLL